MSNLVTIGEMLMDFREPIDCKETNLYSASVGGSPANVSVQAAKLGTSSSFIGKVGNDHFGKLMKKTLSEYGVSTENLILDSKFLTALAFVNIQDRRRQFTFYRKNCADTQLQFSEVDTSVIDDCKIFHFGSISLTDEPSKSTTIKAVEYAKNSGKIISYDPNWRPNLWASKGEAIEIMQCLLEKVDIIKVSEDELQMLTDCDKLVRGISKLLEFGIKIVVVTQGAKGCIVAGNGEIACMPTYD
ncbi:MAG: carbohydrate kinase, partial [Oscillospiraceae bacterium]